MTNRMVALVTLFIVGVAPAQAIGEWYLGGGIGISNVEDTLQGSSDDLVIRLEEDDFGFKLFGGYQVLEILSIEAGYRDFGSFTSTAGLGVARSETDGIDVYGVINLPLGPIDLFAKAGFIRWDTEASVTELTGEVTRFDDSGTDLAAGIGLGFSLFELGARVEYEIFDVSRPEDLDMFSFSLTYGF